MESKLAREQLWLLFLFLYGFNAPGGVTALYLFIQRVEG